MGDHRIGEAVRFGIAQLLFVFEDIGIDLFLKRHNLLDLIQKPGIDSAEFVHLFDTVSPPESFGDEQQTLAVGTPYLFF